MRIAKIISSNSHVEYIARVIDSLDVANPPAAADYGFGTFVGIEAGEGNKVVGVVFNSMLVNPEYANFGPRLSPQAELETFSPDFLNEQGNLLAILLLGRLERDGLAVQNIPLPVIPAGESVERLDQAGFKTFHTAASGKLTLSYYSQVVSHTGHFAFPLLEKIIGDLSELDGASVEDIGRLSVLRKSLVWQRTVG